MNVLISLVTSLLGFIFKGVVAKFFIFFSLFYITTEFIPVIIDLFIPNNLIPDLNELFGQLPESIWYFLNTFQFPLGISLFVSAMLARFIIRRLPIIG
ncbi:putative phage-related membrane protein [Actinobacillus minor 202]|uniref:Phage-related membrane protein n=1 Tax=Actinobacillus minor 202 TaxID=591023 RepID=A0ABP2GU64_9PAST|nr:DUF2523 family protein [Actinobacillus minor]EEV25434.1 putative phage-related membrane protein [Actinobacillus minor 202]